ncbi:Antigen WC1.1 [Camelus dromedarius]|uniref:Antigen WC1.1 n=1 Tax=Camelus dromedarius TaxID=9838 RepID=A0A5N4C6B6_CAMDR|nr:Antigen WC1.1 [Camelus dromedarius]
MVKGVFCSWDCALDDMAVKMALNGQLSLQGLCFLHLSIMVGGQALKLRLMDGGHRCKGRVEVEYQGIWGTVSQYLWDLQDAAVVCRQLGCGDAFQAPIASYFGPGVGPIWLFNVSCEGTESALHDCSQNPIKDYTSDGWSHNWDAGAVCSGFVHLVGGHGPCSGQVEVHSGKEWTPVSDGNFTFLAAQVICAELGCGKAVSLIEHVPFRGSDGQIWEEEFGCTGEEPELWSCPRVPCPGGTCRHSGAVQVVCSGNQTQVLPQCNDSVSEPGGSAASEGSPANCSEFLALRMVSEDQECAGWLEVFYNGTWGSVCRSPMDDFTLSIVCSQLGCGDRGQLDTSVALREGSRPRWVDLIQCRRTDTSLWECPSDPWKYNSCSPKEEAYVSCAGDLLPVSTSHHFL